MSSRKKHPEVVADAILKRAELGKITRKLKATLALAKYKTEKGWQDLSLDAIEPLVEEELRQKRPLSSGNTLSESSSSSASGSDFRFPPRRNLMSSPLKEAAIFSDQLGPRSGSTSGSGYHTKRSHGNAFEHPSSSVSKKYRSSPTSFRTTTGRSANALLNLHQTMSSPIKARKQTHFTTTNGPALSFYPGSSPLPAHDHSTNFAAMSDDEEDSLPVHSFNNMRSSPPLAPSTPPPVRNRGSGRRNKDKNGKLGDDGADLLLYLATSPSPANPSSRNRMAPPSTPPPKFQVPSSFMMTPGAATTPGGGPGFLAVWPVGAGPGTPSSNFNFEDYVNVTPSPGWNKTPRATRTPATMNRRNLDFDAFTPSIGHSSSPATASKRTERTGLGMQFGSALLR